MYIFFFCHWVKKQKISFDEHAAVLTSSATDCLAQVFLTWLYIIVLLIPSPQNITNACTRKKQTKNTHTLKESKHVAWSSTAKHELQ